MVLQNEEDHNLTGGIIENLEMSSNIDDFYNDMANNLDDFLNMFPYDVRKFLEMIIDTIKDNYIYIFIVLIIIIIIIIFYDSIYNYIYNIFSDSAVEKTKIEKFNQLSVENDIPNDNLLGKKTYNPYFKDNIESYKENLNSRLSYIKNNIDSSIKHHLSQPKPNYRLISSMKQYKDKLDSIDIEDEINISILEKELGTINKKIITLLLN
tara:strand:- start:281 stop:907 length:627 start_codon:yes stop_codon:yes gene_type:complete